MRCLADGLHVVWCDKSKPALGPMNLRSREAWPLREEPKDNVNTKAEQSHLSWHHISGASIWHRRRRRCGMKGG